MKSIYALLFISFCILIEAGVELQLRNDHQKTDYAVRPIEGVKYEVLNLWSEDMPVENYDKEPVKDIQVLAIN